MNTTSRDLSRRRRYEHDVLWKRRAKRPRTVRCLRCKAKIVVAPKGRLPSYCSQSCRQRMYERRKWQKPYLMRLLDKDLSTVVIQAEIERAARGILRKMGLEVALEPPKTPQRKRPPLRVVAPDEGSGC